MSFSFLSTFKKADRSRIYQKLEAMTDIVNNRNINYCLENDTLQYADKPKRIIELLNSFPEMKYVYDPANFIISGCKSEETIKLLSDKTYYYHIKDAVNKRIVPSGYGNANIDSLIKNLKRDCVCTIEPHLLAFRGISGFDSASLDLYNPKHPAKQAQIRIINTTDFHFLTIETNKSIKSIPLL